MTVNNYRLGASAGGSGNGWTFVAKTTQVDAAGFQEVDLSGTIDPTAANRIYRVTLEVELDSSAGTGDILLQPNSADDADQTSSQAFSVSGTFADAGNDGNWTILDAVNNASRFFGQAIVRAYNSDFGCWFVHTGGFGLANTNVGPSWAAGHWDQNPGAITGLTVRCTDADKMLSVTAWIEYQDMSASS